MHLADAFKLRPSAARWVNLPFIVYSAFAILLGAHEGLAGISLWLVVLSLFTIQLIYPTLAGWFLTVTGWALLFVLLVYVADTIDFSDVVLFFILPMALLIIFRPKLRAS